MDARRGFCSLCLVLFAATVIAGEPVGFLKPYAVQADKNGAPDQWSDHENVLWKTPLPGPGTSSPVIVGDRVFVTCYGGYAVNPDELGDLEKLERHLLCIALDSGKIVWDKVVKAAQPERSYEGFLALHGYASSTAASDGEAVYVFFGRSGVYAYSMAGEELWHADVGATTHGWGSATSPILWKDLVIINASVESGAVMAFDRKTGREKWRVGEIKQSWSTPAIVRSPKGEELVVSLHGKILGLDPATGEKLWECAGVKDYVCPAVVAADGVAYVTGGRKPQTIAVRAGGKGDVTKSHILWEVNVASKVATPLLIDERLHWVDTAGVAVCLDAKSGKTLYKERLTVKGRGDKVYASPARSGDKLLIPSREDGVLVLADGADYFEAGRNRLGDARVFNATPAVVGNRLLLRSDAALYCIGKK